MAETPHAWYHRDSQLAGGLWAVSCRLSDAHPDGTLVDDPGDLRGMPMLWHTSASERGIVAISFAPFAAPEAPPAWFVNVDEPKSDPRATTLVAFTGEEFPAGTVVGNYAFASSGVPSERQIGAIRWYPGSGVVHQVYVGEAWRRRQVGTLLIYAASAFHQANGWPDRLHSDGRRTDLGQQFVAGLRHPDRIQPLSDRMPPMDPSAS